MMAEHSGSTGSFRRYYTFRTSAIGDRLAVLHPKYFRHKRVLDVGCNDGQFTLAVAGSFRPASVLGIDIDSELVAQARANKSRVVLGLEGRLQALFPRTRAAMVDYFNDQVHFSVADITASHGSLAGAPFDTVVCLSVSKWVHLNLGDRGLLRLFDTLKAVAAPLGHLVLEYQLWQSYKNSKNASATTKLNFSLLEIRPEDFPGLLVARGWRLVEAFYMNDTSVHRRPIVIFQNNLDNHRLGMVEMM